MERDTRAEAPERALFARIGEALFGTLWQEAMARALGVSGRSVRYWVAGDHPIPRGVWVDLRGIVEHRREDLAELVEKIIYH